MRGTAGDPRARAVLLTVALVLLGGLVIAGVSGGGPTPTGAPAAAAAARAHEERVALHFRQGVVMLHAKHHEHALVAFDQVLRFAPEMPEAHVNAGFALVGLGRHDQARAHFEKAMALRPLQGNAYYGLAMALEGLGDRRSAMGAMRTYLHLPGVEERYRRKAEAALWEWDRQK